MSASVKIQNLIVCDVGGSNVRFGLYSLDKNTNKAEISHIIKYNRGDFASFHEVLDRYSYDVSKKLDISEWPISVAIAGSRINSESWRFAQDQWTFIRDERIISVISDLNGFALGAAAQSTHMTLRDTKPKKDKSFQETIIAVGTGLGLSYLRDGLASQTHGGHMRAFGVTAEQNTIIGIIDRLSGRGHMSIYEDLASGSGLVRLYQAVCIYNGYPVLFVTPEDIIQKADPQILEQSLRLFHEFLGLFAHMALVYGHGYKGLYLGGGVLDVLVAHGLFDQVTFTQFLNQDAQEAVAQNLENCPIYLITEPYIALYGAAEAGEKALAKGEERL
jgi:glucokinase